MFMYGGGRKQKKYNARMRLEDKEENYWRHARTFCNPLASLALRVRAVSFIRSICLICFVYSPSNSGNPVTAVVS